MSRSAFVLGSVLLIGLVALIAWYTLKSPDAPLHEDPEPRSSSTKPKLRPLEEIVEFAPDLPVAPRVAEPEEAPPPPLEPGEAYATITGQVLGPDGGAMAAEVMVKTRTSSSTTSVAGRFAIRVRPGVADVIARGIGARPLLVADVRCRAGEVKDLGDLQLMRGLSIQGRVLTTEGIPVAGAKVTAFHLSVPPGGQAGLDRAAVEAGRWGALAFSGENGEFSLEGLSETPLLLKAERIDIKMAGQPEEVRPGSTGIRIVVRRLRVFFGQVVSEAGGAPVAGATVNLVVSTERWRISFSYLTQGDGRFAFDLSEDRFSDPELRATAFRVSAPGYLDLDRTDVTLEALVPEAGFSVSLVPTVAEEPGTLKGRVIYDTGAPFRGELTLSFTREGRAGQIQRVATDHDGRFELPGVPPGEYSLRTAAGVSDVLADTGRRLVIPPGGEETVEFTVKRGGDVDIRVFGSDGEPLPGATIEWGERTAVTPGAGALRLPDLSPGPLSLKVSAPGHRPQTVNVAVLRDQAVPVEVRLRAD